MDEFLNTIKHLYLSESNIGNLFTKEQSVIKIQISRCSGSLNCQSKEQIDSVLSQMSLVFAFTDYYFDIDDYSSPIKMNLRSDIAFGFTPNLTKYIVLNVHNNQVTDQPSPYPFPNTYNYNFYSIGDIKQDVFWKTDQMLMNVVIQLD